jgi:DNA-binding response OmpR family regulator
MMKKTVLTVDDDASVLFYLEQVLKVEGYRVITACNGVEGLAAMAKVVPDLAILDVEMPGMNGLALLAAMREQKALSKVPVIFLTVKDSIEDEVRGLKAGVVDYIRKEVLVPERIDILRFRVHNFFALQENERLRGVLATIVSASHEINNPMMVVQGSADLLRIRGLLDDVPEALKFVDRILEASRKIRSVMKRIASLTKFEIKPYLDGVEMLDLGEPDVK